MLQLSKRCVVTVPNLGYWRCRINLASGKMPVTPELPSSWYETENIHLCTIKDFEKLCSDKNIKVIDKIFINKQGKQSFLSSKNPNLFDVRAIGNPRSVAEAFLNKTHAGEVAIAMEFITNKIMRDVTTENLFNLAASQGFGAGTSKAQLQLSLIHI